MKWMIKTTRILGIFTLLFALLVFALAITNFNPPVAFAQNTDAASTLQQATATPIAGQVSEIGSTDGILVMGIVIVLIVTLPLLLRKKGK